MPNWKRWAAQICACLAAQAGAAELSTSPVLQLDPGTHWAPARRVALSADQRLVATASDDKTVRIWQRDGGRLLQVLRPPIGAGAAGRMYGVAFHPSQSLVAVGGTGPAGSSAQLHLFDAQTGEMVRNIDAGPGEIKRLAWSADGRWLLAGFAAPGALKVFGIDGRAAAAVQLRGDCYGVAAGPSHTIAATDTSGNVHLFQLSAAGALERKASAPATAPGAIAVSFSPDGQQLAVVHFSPERNGMVDVISTADGKPVATLRATGIGRGRTQAVAWSADGARLTLGGAHTAGSATGREAIDAVRGYVQEFDVRTRTPLALHNVAPDAVTDLARLDDGRYAFTSFDASWGIVGHVSASSATERPSAAVRRADRLWLDAAGTAVQWQSPGDAEPWSFKLAERVARRSTLADARLPDAPGPMSGTRDWESHANPRPTIQGAVFELAVGEISRAVARIPKSDDVAWGTGHRLARVGPGGRIVWSVAPGSEARAVHGSQDGRFVVAALSDGTLRWYRARDGSLLLSLMALKNAQWVLWSPRGYYDASPGAEQLIGWHVNRPDGQASELFTIGRFRERLFRPDVIDRVLADADEQVAVDTANRERAAALAANAANASVPAATSASSAPRPEPAGVAVVAAAAAPAPLPLPPALVYKQAPTVQATGQTVALDFGLVLPPGEQLTSLVVRRDGILQPAPPPRLPTTFDGKSIGTVTVEVPEGESVIHVVAANAHGFSDALAFTIQRARPKASATGAAAPAVAPAAAPSASTTLAPAAVPAAPPTAAVDTSTALAPVPAPSSAASPAPSLPVAAPGVRTAATKPRLFVFAIGVSRYADARVNPLGLPAKDATDFAAVLNGQHGQAYESVSTRVLTDQMATRDAISKGLAWLSSSVGEKDFGILFMAGHAVNHPNGSYYFLSHDAVADRLPATAVDETSIRSALVRLKGRAVLFVDTCHAGNALGSAKGYSRDISRIANTLAAPENGVIVFASSTGRQESQEKREWGNGAFTKALVAGLKGSADLLRRGRVTFQGLGYYVSAEVEKLTRGEQTPVMIAPPPGLPDFTLALMSADKSGGLAPVTVANLTPGTTVRRHAEGATHEQD